MPAGTAQTIIRASSTPDLLDCPRRWAARSLRKMLEDAGFKLRDLPTHCGAPIGTGVHAIAAYLLKGKRDQGEIPDWLDAKDCGIAALESSIDEAGEIGWDATAANRYDAQRQVIRMGLAYLEHVVPVVEPVLVEESLFADYPGEPDFLIKGQLDNLLTINEITGNLDDLKTGSTPSGVAAQIGTYSRLCQAHGHHVKTLAVDFIKRAPINSKQPQPRPVRISIDKEAAEQQSAEAIDYGIGAVKRFQATGDPASFRANPSSRLCSEKFCPAYGAGGFCRAHLLIDL